MTRPVPTHRVTFTGSEGNKLVRGVASLDRSEHDPALMAGARSLKRPVLLVRGGASELVHEEHVKEFSPPVAHVSYADVAGAPYGGWRSE